VNIQKKSTHSAKPASKVTNTHDIIFGNIVFKCKVSQRANEVCILDLRYLNNIHIHLSLMMTLGPEIFQVDIIK
jgi:hypothetical protein